MIDQLIRLGFTEEEARLYIVCLQVGVSPIGGIARMADIKRQTCLYTLKKLIDKGYLSTSLKNGVVYYVAEDPKFLIASMQEKLKLSESLVPELLSITNVSNSRPKIRFYQDDGVTTVLEEIAEEKVARAITNLDFAIEYHYEELKNFRERRKGKPISTRVITNISKKVIDFFKECGVPDGDEYRFIEPGIYPIENDIDILQSKVAILSLIPGEDYAFVVESTAFANTQGAMFELLWSQAKTFQQIMDKD